MARELPYFKFEVTEWMTGDIVFETLDVQGLFINICALYWKNLGVLQISEIESRYKKKKLLSKLYGRFISQCDGYARIQFLDEQLSDRKEISAKNSNNAKDGWKKRKKAEDATALRSECETDAKPCNKEIEIEIEVEKEEEIKKRKKKKEDMPDGSYQKFLEVYSDWYRERVGVGVVFDGVQGNALKKIITYLIANSKEKNPEGGLAAWEYILQNWDNIEPFLRDQLKVNQIQSNLPNILNQLKNGNSKTKPANNQNNIHAGIDALLAK